MRPGTSGESALPGARDVRLWRGRVDPAAGSEPEGTAWLSAAEARRAESFRFPADRRRFVARAAFRRAILARLLGLDPALLRFVRGPHDKPELDPAQARGLHFSTSGSGNEFLLAVARREVGVDLQERRPLPDLDRVAERILHPAERAPFSALPPAERLAAFYLLWCRKEAILKARGEGFSRPPATLLVGLDSAPLGALRPVADPAGSTFGAVADLAAPPGFAAAVCAAGSDWRIVEERGAVLRKRDRPTLPDGG
ncbi:MAG: 4'-phosphopantetheinyl transferase superfamily protein [Planctomycetota bacterium]